MPVNQRQVLIQLKPLIDEFNMYVQQGNRPAAINSFQIIYQTMNTMLPYITDPKSRQFFITYMERGRTMLFQLQNGSIGLDKAQGFLSPLLDIVKGLLSGVVGAVSADLNGLVTGLAVGIQKLGRGDIFGAVSSALGNILSGKINAIKSLFGIFGR